MAITITPTTLTAAVVNQQFYQNLAAAGGVAPYTFAVTTGALPGGLNITPNGAIYGLPTEITSETFTVTATDVTSVTGTQAFTIAPIVPLDPVQLSGIVSWICTDILKRQDILSVVQDSVVNFYRLLCRKIPFDELMFISQECPLTQGVDHYKLDTIVDVNGAPLNPPLKSIFSIRLTYGPQQASPNTYGPRPGSVRLRRSITRLYDALSYTQPGQTSTYSRFGKTLVLNPPPNAANWTVRFRYWGIAPFDATPINTYICMDADWAELIRWEGLYRAYTALGMTQEASNLVQPNPVPLTAGSPRRRVMSEVSIIPRLWNDLCATLSARENADEDFSINPVVRDYSVR